MSGFDPTGLAARVAGLIHGQFRGDLHAAAHALDVDPDELFRIVEDHTRYPNIDLLARIVKRFGVDASWLITGEYDWRSHAAVLENEDASPDRQLLLRLVGREETGRRVMQIATPRSVPAIEETQASRESA